MLVDFATVVISFIGLLLWISFILAVLFGIAVIGAAAAFFYAFNYRE